MNRIVTLVCLLLSIALITDAQNVRTYSGWGNNIDHPEWGAVHTPMLTRTTVAFGNGFSSPAGASRANPRLISNYLMDQKSDLFSDGKLSDYVWAFGQFVDHDITLVFTNSTEFFPISINFPDPVFNPGGAFPSAMIPMTRSATIPGTGTEAGNPRKYANQITAFVDASAVYGSDSTHAAWLRTYTDGKMKVSTGNLLPYNTIDGELNSPQDPSAPILENATQKFSKLFVGGDIRVNENIFLTALHTLFVREHNHQCDVIKRNNPDWTDEQIYQHARKIVGGIFQNITNSEFLPTLGVNLPAYSGYKSDQDPGIFNIFSAAAYRLGHTLLSSNLHRSNNLGGTIPEGDILLRDAFFNPAAIQIAGGVNPLLKGMAHQMQQEFDGKVVDDVRNFLFGGPGSGGMDLAAINMQRGRDRGLADFNTTRADFGLPKYTSFLELTDNEELANFLKVAYVNVDNIDPWVGYLVEKKVPGSLFGETLIQVMVEQFTTLRDGDRFYFENDADLSAEEKAAIKSTTLYDVVMRNSNITVLQKNLFIMESHYDMCKATEYEVEVGGSVVANLTEEPLQDVELSMSAEYMDDALSASDEDGVFTFGPTQTCRGYHLKATKEDTYKNGLSVADLILMRRHLTGSPLLASPYQLIAADVNANGDVSIADLLSMRKVLIGAETSFAATEPWAFVNNAYIFSVPTDPFAEVEAASDLLVKPLEDAHVFDVRGVKIGDLNGTVKLNGLIESEIRNSQPLVLEAIDRNWNAGETFEVTLQSPNIDGFAGFQFTFQYDLNFLQLDEVRTEAITLTEGVNYHHVAEKGSVAVAADWPGVLNANAKTMTLVFKALRKGELKNAIHINGGLIVPEAVSQNFDITDVILNIRKDQVSNATKEPFVLFGNQPNPFNGETIVSFELPEAGDVLMTVFDLGGRQLLQRNGYYYKGYNQLSINRNELGTTGLLIYQVSTAHGTATQRMIIKE
ncbi:MAG: T9SS type A sorting domain-containing protein [Saprospiraceae bacterium]|nr:T9SS type A sorting domain-containing protein [Saprospiraceae bacterium]